MSQFITIQQIDLTAEKDSDQPRQSLNLISLRCPHETTIMQPYTTSLYTSLRFLIWPRGYKTFSCSTQLSTNLILLINVKMPTTVGILTFISIINTTSERPKAKILHYLTVF